MALVNTQQAVMAHNRLPDEQAFATEDVLLAIGIWSVILTLSPLIVLYMLT